MDDQQLVEKVIDGDKQAFSQLIKKYQRLVASVVFKLINDQRDREELVQDIFVKIYQKIGEFRFNSKLSTWIATISYREAISVLRKKKKVIEDDFENVNFGQNTDHFGNQDRSEFIKGVIDTLPHNYAVILTLYHIEGFNYSEIVEIMEMPEGTVKNYLFRARKKLKDLLIPYLEKEQLLYE